ncbi:MAG TPA: tubulin-like doman-containing protein [Ktedonobacteraceae bacterium]|nr:tubulin-like doman-containing protein [Ktedonobacteraceae bacterium]
MVSIRNAQQHSPLEADLPRVVAAPRILTPMLVVLLGSTASLAGLELMRQMLALSANDRRKIALVYIDTDDPPAPLVEFRNQHNNSFQEFPLRIAVPTGISNADRIDVSDQHTFIEAKVPQYFANGAGGIRNNGHVAACFNYQYIRDILDRAVVAITHLGLEEGISEVQEVQANLVAFLGGGTGSGTLADIAIMVRDLLAHQQYKQRLNLFCLLPEPINGVNPNDLKWRKSNATAGLLEILAYSRAAATNPIEGYKKLMRGKTYRLSNDPIANEVYLIGHSSMADTGDTARIVGLDLYQRATDASGVGFLEHSQHVDRRTLGSSDNRGLPTMFGTSCPMAVRFPAEETARAFAQVSASFLLPLLAGYQPATVQADEGEKREWLREWNRVARLDANAHDPQAIRLDDFRRPDFEDASQSQLDILWTRLERFEHATEQHIREIIEAKRREELNRIKIVPQQANGQSLIEQRIHYLSRLLQEYTTVAERLKERELPRVPSRPHDLEDKLVRQVRLPGMLQRLKRDYAGAVCEAYNERMNLHARAARVQALEQLLKELQYQAQDALNQSLAWFRDLDADEQERSLREKGMGSMAWQGRLDYPHPHQRHLFDLKTLRTQDKRNIAVEQLYIWATGGEKALKEKRELDYAAFVDPCVAYLAQYTPSAGDDAGSLSINDHIAGRLAEHVVSFFEEYYLHQFEDINLIELFSKAAPPPQQGQTRAEQISDYLAQHLAHIRGLMRSLVAFEAELWAEGLSTLETSLYVGIHWREGSNQEELFQHTLKQMGALTRRGQTSTVQLSYDPHRLDAAYSQHALSLNTVRDFYLEENSAMEYYQEYQKAWEETSGSGLMPVHSSGEVQKLVRDGWRWPGQNGLSSPGTGQQKTVLGYTSSLVELVIRRPSIAKEQDAQGGNTTQPQNNGAEGPLPSSPSPQDAYSPSFDNRDPYLE